MSIFIENAVVELSLFSCRFRTHILTTRIVVTATKAEIEKKKTFKCKTKKPFKFFSMQMTNIYFDLNRNLCGTKINFCFF